MTHDDIARQVRQILIELGAAGDCIQPDARLVTDLGLDSLELATAVVALEGDFDIELGDALDEMATVGSVVDAVAAELEAGDAAA